MHCSYFEAYRCRSCTQLPQSYAAQLAAKVRHCRGLLDRQPALQWSPPVASRESAFRNKAKMVVGGSVAQPTLGILDRASLGIDLSDCPLYPTALQACFAPLKTFIADVGLTPYSVAQRSGELKYALITLAEHSGDLMLRLVLRTPQLIGRIRANLSRLLASIGGLKVVSVNLQPEHKAILEGAEEILLTEQAQLTMRVNGIPLHLRPQSFFQTNTEMAAALYAQAREWAQLQPTAEIWDLYCGVGGFALHCADGARRVIGVELSREAIASAEQSRSELGLGCVEFRVADASEFALDAGSAAGLIIVNPPRRGIGAKLCRYLNESAAQSLIYSSCNTETLAADLARMPGWRLQRARLIDMFPHTDHYEVITLLDRATG